MNAFEKHGARWAQQFTQDEIARAEEISRNLQDSVLPEPDEDRHQRMKTVADLARRMGDDESSGPWRYPPQKPTPAPSVPVVLYAFALCLVMAALMVWGRL